MLLRKLTVLLMLLIALGCIYLRVSAIYHRIDPRLCRTGLHLGSTTDFGIVKFFHQNDKFDGKYIQLNFNILNSEGIKGYIRGKALDRLIFGLMQDLYCTGLGNKVSISYTMPFWDDNNIYEKTANNLSPRVPEYYVSKYKDCKFEQISNYTITCSATGGDNTRLFALTGPEMYKNIRKYSGIMQVGEGDHEQHLCPYFSHKYPLCPHYNGTTFYNLNSTKPFKQEYSEVDHDTVDRECIERMMNASPSGQTKNWWKQREKTIESISAIYGSGFTYGSKPSLLSLDFHLNNPGKSLRDIKFVHQSIGYPDNYFEDYLENTYDQDDVRASFLESHTYTGGRFYDGRSDIDYNYLISERPQLSNQIDFRIPPYNSRGHRPIYEQFSYQFNIKRDLIASFAYISDIKLPSSHCNYEQKVNIIYDDFTQRFVNETEQSEETSKIEYYAVKQALDRISKNFNCWGDPEAIKVVVTVVSDEPQDYSSNLDIMWNMYMSGYEIAGPGTLGDRVKGRERATGHKHIDFTLGHSRPTTFLRTQTLEQLADTIVKRQVRHIVVVVDSKNTSIHSRFIKLRKHDPILARIHKNRGDHLKPWLQMSNNKSDIIYKNNRTETEHLYSSTVISALDYIIGYHGANSYYSGTRRLNIKKTLENLEYLNLGGSLQAMVLKKGGYFNVISARDLEVKPLVPYNDKVDKLSLFDLVESASAFSIHNYVSKNYREDKSKYILPEYRVDFKPNNRTVKPRPYSDPNFIFFPGDDPDFEPPRPFCRKFDDIEDLLTYIIMNAHLFKLPYAHTISALVSQALNNIDRFVEFFYDKLSIVKLMETYYHEPLIVIKSDYIWKPKVISIPDLCSDVELFRGGDLLGVEEVFEQLIKERGSCHKSVLSDCDFYGFVITLVNSGFDTISHRPTYKAVLKPFCASPTMCHKEDYDDDDYATMPCGSITSCSSGDPAIDHYGIRSTMKFMRVLNTFDHLAKGYSDADLEALYVRTGPFSHIPDMFYGNSCNIAKSPKCMPSYLKEIIGGERLAYSAPVSNADIKKWSTVSCSNNEPRPLIRSADFVIDERYYKVGCGEKDVFPVNIDVILKNYGTIGSYNLQKRINNTPPP